MRIPPLSFVLVASFLPLAARAQEPVRPFTFVGQVMEVGSQKPVAFAVVSVEDRGIEVVADSLGRFAVPDLSPGLHRLSAEQLGYVKVTAAVEVLPGKAVVLRLRPKPVLLRRIEVITNGLERREKGLGYASFASGREELLVSTAPTMSQYLEDHFQTPTVPCPQDWPRGCLLLRGRASPVQVYVDDLRMAGGLMLLDIYDPRDFYRVELFPALRQIRVYTPQYVERMARNGFALPAICIVCE